MILNPMPKTIPLQIPYHSSANTDVMSKYLCYVNKKKGPKYMNLSRQVTKSELY